MTNYRVDLWGDYIQPLREEEQAKKVLAKLSKPKKVEELSDDRKLKSKRFTLEEKLNIIKINVNKILGVYADNTLVIRDKQGLVEYIDRAIENGIIAIDTETNNSLDPLTCKLMGPCLYTPGLKQAYIPINHINKDSEELLPNQLTEQDLKEQFERLKDTKIVMHNGSFDYQVVKCTCNCELNVYWDTMIAAQLLNENESAKLKYQYSTKIDPTIEKYSIETFFEDIPYAVVDPELFALYAATDAYITYKLYEWQVKEFNKTENNRLLHLFLNVEMPVVVVTAEMELRGVCLNTDYADRLYAKYSKLEEEATRKIQAELDNYRDKIASWRLSKDANIKVKSDKPNKDGEYTYKKSKNEQLTDPVDLNSPTQLAILLYDVLKVPVVDKKNKRGTGKDIMKKLDLPLCKLILEQREVSKLLTTYITKLPKCLNPATHKIHARFNQLGKEDNNVVTGRMSSSDPNLQNIPSHGDGATLRMLFTPTPGYVMLGSDFSAQEPRLLAAYSQDKKMIENYEQKRDLYATVATSVYNNKYGDNLEFFMNEDGTWKLDEEGKKIFNLEGKNRRSSCKSLLLGIMYGRGIASIAEQIKDHDGPVEPNDVARAQNILDTFNNNFPQAKEWFDKTHEDAKTNLFVEDLWGRKRRLPDLALPKYEFKLIKPKAYTQFNPLFNSDVNDTTVPKELQQKYIKMFERVHNADSRIKIEEQAREEGIIAVDNTGKIAQAERQAVNARIQGGAASMTKVAMRNIHNDPIMKELDFHLLIAVHDELIGECPIENMEKAKQRLTELMNNSGKPECTIEMTCDADDFPCWYYDVISASLCKDYNKKIEGGTSKEDAIQEIKDTNSEFTEDEIMNMLSEVL